MQRILVVYYSLGGTTAKLAREIADAVAADVDPIEDAVERTGPLSFVRSSLEAMARGLPSIRTQLDPRDYDVVVLGTPVWAGSMASPMRSFLFGNWQHLRLKRIACFCTMGARGAPATLREMVTLCRTPDAPTFGTTERETRSARRRQRLDDFVRELRCLCVPQVVARAEA